MAQPKSGMHPALVATLVTLALLVGAGLAALVGAARSSASSSNGFGDLLVISADEATVDSGEGASEELVLTGLDPQTLWFTDRPQRLAGVMSTDTLVASWPTFFATSEPNAALTYRNPADPESDIAPIAVELGTPEAQEGTLRFPIEVLDGSTIPVGSAPLVAARLFIDPPAARLTDFHEDPMQDPGPVPIPQVGGPESGSGQPTILIGGLPAARVGDKLVVVGPPSSVVDGNKPAATPTSTAR